MSSGKRIKKRKNLFVYINNLTNSKGLTLLSALFSLSLIILVLPLFSLTLKLVQHNPYEYTIDVEHFFIFLRDDLIDATDSSVKNNTLTLRLNTGTNATYSLYDKVIRRRVQNQGHEIYIRNIHSLAFKKTDDIIHVELTTINGEHYEKTLQIYE